jgi:hypothetical protein
MTSTWDPREGGARGLEQVVVTPSHLALAHERAAPLVHEVDLALDRDDVIAPRPIDEVHVCGNQRPLAAR